MKLKSIICAAASLAAFVVSSADATDLMQVYAQSVKSDPTFQKAESDWQSAKQNFGIALAGYLPQVNISGSAYQEHLDSQPSLPNANKNGWNQQYQFQISLVQPVFNAPNWFQIQSARAGVKAATAAYSLAAQDLMVRSATAYFNVLKAYNLLRFSKSSKRAFYREYITAEQKFKVGLIAITGVYEAKSFYDQAVASVIANENNLYNQIEELRTITGKHYFSLKGLRAQVPLIVPTPNNINAWVSTAQSQNYTIIADEYTTVAARETIKQQATGSLPQFNLSAQYNGENTFGHDNLALGGRVIRKAEQRNTLIGGTLNFPLLQGGLVIASTKQARYNYDSASAQMEVDHRSVVSNTRQSFLGVVSGISKIKADKQSIKSQENSVEATRAGYVVGTRTMVDVLNDLRDLYRVQQSYADDQYNYIISIINLKFAAGTLSPKDLAQINGWMKARINFSLPKKLYGASNKPAMDYTRYMTQYQKVYAVQLYSSRDEKHAQDFILSHKNIKRSAHVMKQGRYYKVVYGRYYNYRAAEEVAHQFSGANGLGRPWVILIGSAQPSPNAWLRRRDL